MKKVIAISCLAALMLTGCTKPNNNNDTESTTDAATTEAETTAEAVTTEEKTTTEAVTVLKEPDTEPLTEPFTESEETIKQRREMFYADVRPMLKLYFDKLLEENGGHAYMEYTFYDVDKCTVPEVIIKEGNSEAEFTIHVFREDGFDGMYQIGEFGGGHTALCYDADTDKLVLAWAQMGAMNISSLDMVDYKLKEVTSDEKKLAPDEEIDDILAEENIKKLAYISVYKPDEESAGYSIIHHADGTEERKEELYFEFFE